MSNNDVEIVDTQSVRGKRGDMIGKITNQGIVPCPFCSEQAAFYVTDYNKILVKYTFCRCGYRKIEHEIIKRRSIIRNIIWSIRIKLSKL